MTICAADVLTTLHAIGVRLIVLRSGGLNHVDLPKAFALGFTVERVTAYSPYAAAEHTVATPTMWLSIPSAPTSASSIQRRSRA
jgi:lactate dehydrogenase-like 2-hydroxyacid dehydrogenase